MTARSIEVTNGGRKFKVNSDYDMSETQITSLTETGVYRVTRQKRDD